MLDIIFPPVCGICNIQNKDSLCNRCKLKLEKESKFEIIHTKDEVFNELLYVFKYEGKIRDKIIQYKFDDKPYLSNTFVNFLLKNKKLRDFVKKYDIITSVPISKKRKGKRGYNQSELIAKSLAKQLQITYEANILKKIQDTVPQSTLNKEERIANSKNVYILAKDEIIKNKKILILDDIYTTGSTIRQCAKMLERADSIGALIIAKD